MRAGVAGVKQYNFSCFKTELLNRFNARHLQCLFSFCSRMQKVLHIYTYGNKYKYSTYSQHFGADVFAFSAG